jgi:hypothetical protein
MGQRALATQVKALGPDHLQVAYVYIHLAGVHRALGDVATARSHYERGLAVQERVNGVSSRPVFETVALLANLEFERGSRARARELYERDLRMVEGGLRIPDESLVDLLDTCGELSLDRSRAKELHARAAALRDSLAARASS